MHRSKRHLYSITSSARPLNVSGTVMPSAVAAPAASLALRFRKFILSVGAPAPRPNTKDFFLAVFLFSDIAAPATNGRQAIAPRGQRDPHQPPGRPFPF
jgi:hypothetical protein